jgi:NitT/TauT family transport system ATP-binding protein
LKVHYSVLVGFLEVLDDLGGKSDVAEIASKQGLELDDLLPILESGEMLGLVKVQSGDVSITEKGHLFIAASPKVRKKILRDIIVNLDIFRKLIDLIQQSEKGNITKLDFLDFISDNGFAFDLSNEDDSFNDFDWIIEWGRQSLILSYDANTETIALRPKAS